jgi:hypothetical protein
LIWTPPAPEEIARIRVTLPPLTLIVVSPSAADVCIPRWREATVPFVVTLIVPAPFVTADKPPRSPPALVMAPMPVLMLIEPPLASALSPSLRPKPPVTLPLPE